MFGSKPVPRINVEEVKNALDINKDVVLIDVRTPGEYARGKIKGSINLPVEDLPSIIETVVKDKAQTIYAYCLSGSRSDLAVSDMQDMGYTNVFSVTSGLLAWRAKQYPLEA